MKNERRWIAPLACIALVGAARAEAQTLTFPDEPLFLGTMTAGSGSSVASNLAVVNGSTWIFQTRFDSNHWSGDLQAFRVSTGPGGACGATSSVAAGALCDRAEWHSDSELAAIAPGARTILTYKPSTHAGIAFAWARLDPAQQALLNVGRDTHGSARLDYLRGDHSNENAGLMFRARGLLRGAADVRGVLGDLVDSEPVFVGAPLFPYRFGAYPAYRASHALRTPMIYVGGNDGMLHGFRTDAGTATARGRPGSEQIAYVPNKAFGSESHPVLARLTKMPYIHQFVVDGSPSVGDVQSGAIAGNGGNVTDWSSLLVGTMRSGGQAVFALNVTDPDRFSEANAASVVKWEFADTDDRDLGYTFSKPAIVKLANGKWAAVIGNGYNNTEADAAASSNGAAALFILFTDGPAADGVWTRDQHYVKLTVPGGSVTAPNGLATAAPVDLDGDGIVDYVYAGDLLGNLWRFDLTSATSTDWHLSYAGTPVYVARDAAGVRQAITVRPEVGLNTSTAKVDDVIVYFGTGRYIAENDNLVSDPPTQSFYGIFDDKDARSPPASSGRTALLRQSVAFETLTKVGGVARVTTQRRYSTATPEAGWFIDLFNTQGDPSATGSNRGERQVTAPVLANGRIVFTTLVPPVSPHDPAGTSFLMQLDAKDGSRPSSPKLDADTVTGAITNEAGDRFSVSGIGSTVGFLSSPTILSVDKMQNTNYLSGSSGEIETVTGRAGGRIGRVTWRELSPP